MRYINIGNAAYKISTVFTLRVVLYSVANQKNLSIITLAAHPEASDPAPPIFFMNTFTSLVFQLPLPLLAIVISSAPRD